MANSKDIFKLNITDIPGNNSREILNTYIQICRFGLPLQKSILYRLFLF